MIQFVLISLHEFVSALFVQMFWFHHSTGYATCF